MSISAQPAAGQPIGHPSRGTLISAVLVLFSAWSLSFIAIEALLRPHDHPPRFDWIGLTVGRFVPSAVLCGGWCLLFHRAEAARVVRRYWRRLLPAGLLAVPTTLARAGALGLDPAQFLANNDSTGFFRRIGDLVDTGPTCTNVNDFRAILVDTV